MSPLAGKPTPMVKKCMDGHAIEIDQTMLKLNRLGTSVSAQCPVCRKPIPVSAVDAASIFGMDPKNKIALFAEAKKLQEKSGVEEPLDAEENEIITPEDETMPASEEELPEDEQPDETPVEEVVKRPAPKPQKPNGKSQVRVPMRMPQYAPQQEESEEDSADISSRDLLIDVISASKLPQSDIDGLIEFVKLEQDWDPMGAKGLFEKYGLTAPQVTKMTIQFRNKLELFIRQRQRTENLTNYVGLVSGRGRSTESHGGGYSSGMGNDSRYFPQQHGAGAVSQDPCAAAVNEIVKGAMATGGITSQTLQAIDAVRAAFGQGPATAVNPAVTMPGAFVHQQTDPQAAMMNLFREFHNTEEERKKRDQERETEKAETNRRFEELKTLVMMTMAKPQAVSSPAESETKQMMDKLFGLLEKNATQPPVAGPTKNDMMFDKLFDFMLESVKGKPDAAMQPLMQELEGLKDHVSRLGGGIGGLPTNPDQLRGLIDYTKTMGDIKKTEAEFAEKAANREMISNVLQTGLQSVGEAAAAVFMQNPGTPQQKPVTLPEQPVDDGSVVQIVCPNCGVNMLAPADAPAIRCPECNATFDRQMKVLDKPKETPEAPPVEEKHEEMTVERTPAPTPVPEPAPDHGKDVGPMSKIVMESVRQIKESSPPVPEPAVTDVAAPEANNLNVSGEQTHVEETG